MNKEDIKKALLCCQDYDYESCVVCPYRKHSEDCTNDILKDALDIIKEQESECEYRKKQYDNQVAENTRLHIEYDKAFERIKAQQREIERLKANWYRSIMDVFEDNHDKIMENIRTELDDYKQSIKQAQIDVLNKLKEKCKFDGHTVAVYKNDIDGLIEEVQNGEDKG